MEPLSAGGFLSEDAGDRPQQGQSMRKPEGEGTRGAGGRQGPAGGRQAVDGVAMEPSPDVWDDLESGAGERA